MQVPAAAGHIEERPPHWAHGWMALVHVGGGGGGGGVGVGVHIHHQALSRLHAKPAGQQ